MNETRPRDRRLRLLFFALACLYVLPFWTVRYLPMVDGPCHTYNSWILRQHGNVEQYPLFNQYYEINTKPYPNWIGHGTMALLMFAVPPLVAEKLLVSGYVLLFLGGFWYLAGSVRPAERWLAFLAFPFAYHQLFQFGFYNFSISLALFPWILGYWWRNREAPGLLAFAVKINFLLWLCYFSHILSFLLALAAIGILWLATLQRESWRRHLLHIPILLPQVALPIWFFLQNNGGEIPDFWPLRRHLSYFSELHVLFTFNAVQHWLGIGIAVLFLLLFLFTFWRKSRQRPFFRQEDLFLLLALLAFALFLFSPQGLQGGSMIKPRLSLYPYLLLIPWFSPGLSGTAKKAGTAMLALSALLYLGYLTHWYRVRGAEVAQYLSALDSIQPNTRVLTLLFNRPGVTDVLSHAVGYKAIEKGLIDWDNYEARYPFFPTRFRGSVAFPDAPTAVTAPAALHVNANLDRIDAVYTWKMWPGILLRKRLKRHYRRVSAEYGGELYEIRRDAPGIESPHARPSRRRRDGPRAGVPGRGPRQDRAHPRRERPGRRRPGSPGGAVLGM